MSTIIRKIHRTDTAKAETEKQKETAMKTLDSQTSSLAIYCEN